MIEIIFYFLLGWGGNWVFERQERVKKAYRNLREQEDDPIYKDK